MKKLSVLILLLTSLNLNAQNNLVKDGGFENQEIYENNQIARLASFSNLGEPAQITNPVVDKAMNVERGIWYKKAGNTGYLKATVINSDSQEGDKSLLLSIAKNSPQKNLDKWETTAILQFVEVEKSKSYTLKFFAKANIDCDKIFVGLVSGRGQEMTGCKWIDINSEWKEYSLNVNVSLPKKGKFTNQEIDKTSVVFGLSASYDNNERSNQTSVIIDNVELIEK